ncbi:MAG: hypothetical protein RLZ51_225 [Pseudomonadota bacterium]
MHCGIIIPMPLSTPLPQPQLFTPVALPHASRLINHGPTVLITSKHEGRPNVMAAAWSMPVEFTPPRLALVIDKKTVTARFIEATGVVGICIPCAAQADLCYAVGSVSLDDPQLKGLNKFESWGIRSIGSPALGVPLIEGCVAWMEARVIQTPGPGGMNLDEHARLAYDTVFVEVVGAWADERVFSQGRWHFSEAHAELETIHHLGGGLFALPSKRIQAKPML